MKGISFLSILIILAIVGVFFGGVVKVVDPLDIYYKYLDDGRKKDLVTIQKAIDQYYQENNQYPRSTGSDGGDNCTANYLILDRNPNTQETEPVRWDTMWFRYSLKMPVDPDGNRCYAYVVSPTRQSYWLYTSLLRDTRDPEACSDKKPCNNMIANGVTDACHRKTSVSDFGCNYGLSSPNESL